MFLKFHTLIDKYCLSGLTIARPSSFWSGVLSFTNIYNLGIDRIVGNGFQTHFWLDRWCSPCALYCIYPNLFAIATDPSITVHRAFTNSTLSIQFSRQLTGILVSEWLDLTNLLSSITLNSSHLPSDLVKWRWTPSGNYTVHSLYLWLTYGGYPNQQFEITWQSKVPLKIKIFIWLLRQDKVLTKSNLANRGWIGDLYCPFCGLTETADHLFVTCSFATAIWS